MVFSNSSFAATLGSLNVKSDLNKPTNNREMIPYEELDEKFDPTDQVRIVVEVEGDPAIQYATNQGVKFTDLAVEQQENLINNNLSTQEQVKQTFTQNKVDMKYEHSFTTVFNGFSGHVEYRQLKLIENLPGVKSVSVSNEYERPEFTPDMNYSTEIVQAQQTWRDHDYDGTGMIVGVIDTGADPSHRDFVLTNEEEAALDKETVDSIINEKGLPGKYFSPKVPYGYNYMDNNQEVRDLGPNASEHGMHVSGTVGANGDIENGGVKGVAPEAQILALKVFGNDPGMGSTWADIYIKAFDDAINLGADVLNLSLGSPSAFVSPDDPEQRAVRNAVEHGILVSISAGNSSHFGYGYFSPYPENPDIGVVGSPGVSYESLQVASVENSVLEMDAITYYYDDVEGKAAFLSAGDVHPHNVEQKDFEVLYAGLGGPEDFEGQDFTGKYALVVRGEHPFVDKALNAQAAGASGVIIYNNEDGVVNMQSDPAIVIPHLFMFKADGDLLAEQIQNGVDVSISFLEDKTTQTNPLEDQLSDFSSQGVTPNLDFKPEITAPGGSILSTLQNDSYGMSSGTSMAAPHVAGGAALVLQHVDKYFDGNLTNQDRVLMAKNILMNTSQPLLDKGFINDFIDFEIPYSPRRQGAGVMKLNSAVTTPAVVTETETGEAKVALREVGDTFSFTLDAHNFSDETVTYDIDANIQSDLVGLDVLGAYYFTGDVDALEAADMIADITINGGEDSITIEPGETATIEVEVDLTDAGVVAVYGSGTVGYVNPDDVFPNGYFVEGFVTLTDPSDNNPNLVVPYTGFKGDWNDPPILDELGYDGNDSFYGQAGMVYEDDGGFYYLGFDPFNSERLSDKIAFSPNTDSLQDRVIPVLSYLRNAKTVEYYVLDEDGNEMRKLLTENNIRKNYYDMGRGPSNRINSDVNWDGTVNGQVVEDGQYYFEVRPTIDYEGKEAQSFKIPVIVDTVAPELEVELDGHVLSVDASDDGSGLKYIEVLENGTSIGVYAPDTTGIDFGSDIPEGTNLEVIAVDYAGNESSAVLSGINDTEPPVIYVTSHSAGAVFDTNEVTITGYITDESEIVELKMFGEDVDFEYDSALDRFNFEATVTLEDGIHTPDIYAKDSAGNEQTISNSRFLIVDTTAPVIEVDTDHVVNNTTESINVNVGISDNFAEVKLFVNDNEVFSHDRESNHDDNPINEEIVLELDNLNFGENNFTLKLVDIAGHTTIEEVTVYRENVSRLSGDNRYGTAVEASQKGWESSDVAILARGDDYADALAGVPLAKMHDAPLLLTQSDRLTAVTQEELERLGVSTVYVLGGTTAINDDVKSALEEMDIEVTRISGGNRAETAVAIAEELIGDSNVDQAVVVNGYNFPDALSVASYAAIEGLPILITQEDTLSKATAEALTELGITETLVIGGSVAISDEVVKELPDATRISGDNRIETALEVAKYFGLDSDHYYVATGYEFPDALSGAALAAKEETGILLVGQSVIDEMSDFVAENNIDSLTVLGGTVVVSDEVFSELKQLFN